MKQLTDCSVYQTRKRAYKMRVLKFTSKLKKMFTYFEFDPCSTWEDFDVLKKIFLEHFECEIVKELEAIYVKSCVFRRGKFVFELMYHDDYGNILLNQEKQKKQYYLQLEQLAHEVVNGVNADKFDLKNILPSTLSE